MSFMTVWSSEGEVRLAFSRPAITRQAHCIAYVAKEHISDCTIPTELRIKCFLNFLYMFQIIP